MTTQQQCFTGIISNWIRNRGFGFIFSDGSTDGIEIFVHMSDSPNRQPLAQNTRVKFQIGTFGGRTKATQIEVLR